jgi:hypothetical protein
MYSWRTSCLDFRRDGFRADDAAFLRRSSVSFLWCAGSATRFGVAANRRTGARLLRRHSPGKRLKVLVIRARRGDPRWPASHAGEPCRGRSAVVASSRPLLHPVRFFLYRQRHQAGCQRACSDRELLTHSEKVRTAATETVRNGVRQAIMVAEVKNKNCGGANLVDFIFNYEHGGWKLFSAP